MKTVTLVMKNGDFTEDRGPMFFDRAFSTKEKAIEYVQKQNGIFGSKQYKEGKQYRKGVLSFNGYDVHVNVTVD
jgi:hypothetical protein